MTGNKCKICTRLMKRLSGYYGAQCCSACAAFFNRAQIRNVKYCCVKMNNSCLVTPSKTGARCRKCRLRKCYEIGMCKNKNQRSRLIIVKKEYMVLAKKIYSIFTIVTQYPQYLFDFFITTNEKCKLLIEADKLVGIMEPLPVIRSWAKIFQSNQIPMNEAYLLLYSIMSNIKFFWLDLDFRQKMSDIQNKAIQMFLQPSAYSSLEIKEGFDKITEFFYKQYLKIFVFKKLQQLKAHN